MIEVAIGLAVVLCLVLVAFALSAALDAFWAWYEDAVWDEQEEDRPEPDDFPDSK